MFNCAILILFGVAQAAAQPGFSSSTTVDLPGVSATGGRQLFLNDGKLFVLSEGNLDVVAFPDRIPQRSRFPIGEPYPVGAIFGDLNGDGSPDIAGVDYREVLDQALTVLFRQPDSAWRHGEGLKIPGLNMTSAAADLNGDGFIDLLYAQPESSLVMVLQGLGNGNFRLWNRYPAPRPESLALADWDGDGNLDLFTADPRSGISMLPGNGDGGFRDPVLFHATAGVSFVKLADLNADGRPELLATRGERANGSLLVFANGRQTPSVHGSGAYGPAEIAIGDLDGDGLPEVIVANSGSTSIAIFYGLGGEVPALAQLHLVKPLPINIRAADLDGDGRVDLVVSSFGGPIVVLWNDRP